MNRNRKSVSILKKLLLPMVIVILVQTVIFTVTILSGGTLEKAKTTSLDIFHDKVANRTTYVQNEMVQRWSNFDDSVTEISKTVSAVLKDNKTDSSAIQTDLALSNQILEEISEDLIYCLRKNSVTGAFIVLNSKTDASDSSIKSGIYIRDLNPLSNPNDNSDILLEIGSSKIAKKLGIALDTRWSPNFDFTENIQRDSFFREPFQAAVEYPYTDYSDLGYWSTPFRLVKDGLEVITYSVPLMDEDNQVYGVLGVEVTLDYFRKMIPSDELAEDQNGAYVICIRKDGEEGYRMVLYDGGVFQKLFGGSDTIQVSEKPNYKNIYSVSNEAVHDEALAAIQPVSLYNTNTPFEKINWYVIGLEEENILLSFSNTLQLKLFISIVLMILIGLMGIIIASTLFTRPIKELALRVRGSGTDNKVKLDTINIREIDDLTSAIEVLSNAVVDTASKMSQIMDMVDLPIGAFEYYFDSNKVFCTDKLFEILNVDRPSRDSIYIDKKIIDNIRQGANHSKREQDEYTVEIGGSGEQPKWIKIKETRDDKKIFGVIMDVTKDTLEKQNLERERDYDILTDIYNRRAFYDRMQALFEHREKLKTSALIMWDLDNLKYINDTYGHDYGDEYIRQTADVLKCFNRHRALVARMSGDEFFVFVYGYDSKEEIRNIIAEIRELMHKSILDLAGTSQFKIRASAGIAWYPDDAEEFEMLIKYADFAMYKVKHTTKGEVNEFKIADYEKDSFLLDSKEELDRLIDEELVNYVFQPIVSAKDASVYAYEALMRPITKGLKTPLDVIKIAKSQSKLGQIERLTWFNCMRTYRENIDKFSGTKLFVNSIANACLNNSDIKLFERLYEPYLDRIVMELTEGEKINDELMEVKESYIKKWGAQIAIDDFGSGYNSESVLLFTPADYVKIDISIVRDIDTDKEKQAMMQSLAGYLKSRDIKIIAEGVETRQEMEMLVQLGVDYMQGFYFGKGTLSPRAIDGDVVEAVIRCQRNNE